ncbi:MAG: dihydroorotase, partial [Chloroflexota bacterium]|nr:dihydroorotase [Chloroflexota bacterium]
IEDGRIAAMGAKAPARDGASGAQVIQARGLVACPGFIDIHCHLREPGQEHKETIATGTLAAARGGFTTVCCMPNTLPAIDSVQVVEYVQRVAREQGAVRVYPIGAITKGRAGVELSEMAALASAGVVGFSDDGNAVADANLMRLALTYALDTGLPLMEHCEDPSLVAGGVMNEGWVATRLGLRGVPASSEEALVARDIALAEQTGGRLHICHISTAGAVELVRRARDRGLRVTAEVTPHHLTITDEWVAGAPEGAWAPLGLRAYDTSTRVNPPLRTRRDAEALAQALAEGVIDCVATDHAPHDSVSKATTYQEAAPGLSVLETALGSLMSLVHGGKLTLPVLVERLTLGPDRVMGGRFADLATLKPGTPADITLFDPDSEWVVDTGQFASKGHNTPLEGVTLKGKVMATIVGGALKYSDTNIKLAASRD